MTAENMMPMNYVLTVVKPGIVTHSCVGNFTSPVDKNLIVAKCTRIEIYLISPQGLQFTLELPIFGRIVFLESRRPQGESQDSLLIAVHKGPSRVLKWNNGEIVSRIFEHDEMFEIMPFEHNSKLKEAINKTWKEDRRILDVKFSFGCAKPTIVILYHDEEYDFYNLKSYKICLNKLQMVKTPWSREDVGIAESLFPVPPPFCGVLVMGQENICYSSACAWEETSISRSHNRICMKLDNEGLQYLLGDHDGLLHRLTLITNDNRVTGLKLDHLGVTSIPSSISYIENDFVFIGSRDGDSQLIKLKLQLDAKGSFVEVLESYVNLGPIADFCVVDLERQGQSQVVTCSRESSIGIVRTGITINELESIELQGITDMWSLRSNITSPYDTFLVVSIINGIRVFSMKSVDVLEETSMDGFCSDQQTLFCHDAAHEQLVQVTSNTVRLVSSATKELLNEWSAPEDFTISVATANVSQVLLATGCKHLIHLAIGNGVLTEVKCTQLEYEISCMDIIPIGDKQDCSQLAAVGTWTNMVAIFSLSEMNLIRKEHLGGGMNPRSILFCIFEGISYLLCGLADGHLLNFVLNTSNGELADRKKVHLGTEPITLRAFSSKGITHVFAASDRATIMHSSNKKLVYINVNPKDVRRMCLFNAAYIPDSFAIVNGDELKIGTVDGIQKLHTRTIPLKEHAGAAGHICHQEQTETYAICSDKVVHLLDDQTFKIVSTFPLNESEYNRSLISCSFSDDPNVYYCVGTALTSYYHKGRILIFSARGKTLTLIGEKVVGWVRSLCAFKGKLLCASEQIELYTCELRDDGTIDFQVECSVDGKEDDDFRHLNTFEDYIVANCWDTSLILLHYQSAKKSLEPNGDIGGMVMASIEMIDEHTYVGAESKPDYNLVTIQRFVDKGFTVVGGFHLGHTVTHFRKGSQHLLDLGVIQTVLFSTKTGVIGVLAALPQDQFNFLNKLQKIMREVIMGVGGLSHEDWRSYYSEKRTVDDGHFVDGDFIASYLDVGKDMMEEISVKMEVPVDKLRERVQMLTWLENISNAIY